MRFRGTIAQMSDRSTSWLAAGFTTGLLLTGIPFWRLPYNANFLADPFLLLGFAGLGMVAAALAFADKVRLKAAFWTTMAAFPVAVALRVIVETSQDPTDHNLWPFELLFAGAVSAVAVVPGLLLGALLRRLTA